MNNTTKTDSLAIENMRISTRYNHVLFPLDFAEFAKHLQKIAYSLVTKIPPPHPNAIERKGYTGQFAQKENTIIDINSERQYIGVTDAKPDILLSRYEEICHILHDESAIGCKLLPFFTEFTGHFKYWPKGDVFDILREIGPELPVVSRASEILGAPAAFRNLRISSQGISVDSTTYSEIVIEPAPCGERHALEIILVSRNPNPEIVKKLVGSVEDKLSKYLKICSSV